MSAQPCDVTWCSATVAHAGDLCAVHLGAKRLDHVMAGARCLVCKRLLVVGEWVTRDSTLEAQQHAVCPPKRPAPTRKIDRDKPLFAAEGVADEG